MDRKDKAALLAADTKGKPESEWGLDEWKAQAIYWRGSAKHWKARAKELGAFRPRKS